MKKFRLFSRKRDRRSPSSSSERRGIGSLFRRNSGTARAAAASPSPRTDAREARKTERATRASGRDPRSVRPVTPSRRPTPAVLQDAARAIDNLVPDGGDLRQRAESAGAAALDALLNPPRSTAPPAAPAIAVEPEPASTLDNVSNQIQSAPPALLAVGAAAVAAVLAKVTGVWK